MYGSSLIRSVSASGRARSGRLLLARASFSSSTNGDHIDADDPLQTIRSASDALSSFSARLRDLSSEISKPVTLPSGQIVTLKDIVLHSRDADEESFGAPAAVSARATVLPLAEKIEKDMKSIAEDYGGPVAFRMASATKVCQYTPCGGASWELEEEAKGKGGEGKGSGGTLHMTRMDTPCGRLHKSSIKFVELTHETREDVALGSRAACLLRMAEEHGVPLASVRKTEEGRKAMGREFAKNKVPTPWVRSDEEYKEYFRIRDETA